MNILSKQRHKQFIVAFIAATAVITAYVRLMPHTSHVHQPRGSVGAPSEANFSVFGTYGRLVFWEEQAVAQPAEEAIITRLQDLHNRINVFDKKSELSRLNASAYARPFHCSDQLWTLLQAARQAYNETNGAFDVTVGPLMALWGFHSKRNRLPDDKEIATTLAAIGFKKNVTLDDKEHTIHFSHPDTYIDFGGLAKGFALDLAAGIATTAGVERGLIDLGGNVRCLSKPPPGREAYTVGVRDPMKPDSLLGRIRLRDCAVATSGNYENVRTVSGRRIGHIVNPRSGHPTEGVAGVSVVAPSGLTSDVFSTAIFVDGDTLASVLCKNRNPAGALIVRPGKPVNPPVQMHNWHWADASDYVYRP